MRSVLEFIRPDHSFDSETLIILGQAYDKALGVLRAGQSQIVREAMATRIFDLAAKGERDPERLYKGALNSIGSRL